MKDKLKRWGPALLLLLLTPLLVWTVLHTVGAARPASAVPQLSAEQTMAALTQAQSELTVTEPQEHTLTVSQPTLHISGTTNPLLPLTVAGEPTAVAADGSFSALTALHTGENTVTVTDGIQTVTLLVQYQPKLVLSVSPTKAVTSRGNTQIQVTAEVKAGTSVQASLAGQVITLQEASKTGDTVCLTGTLRLGAQTAARQNLGRIQFKAKNKDITQTVQGASVTILPKELPQIPIDTGTGTLRPPETVGKTVQLENPSKDYGRGQAKLLLVQNDYAETTPAAQGNDHSTPLCTALVQGTYDYIVASKTYGKHNYYVTRSGLLVNQKDCRSLDGYVLPTNTASVQQGKPSELILTMNWKVPFQAEVKPQTYQTGYQGRAFNVQSCTASYVDFKFYYTNAASGKVDFSGSPVVSSAKWMTQGGKDGTSTLRVYLRQSGAFYGYRAFYSSDNRLHIAFTEPHRTAPKVVLDIGHGGKDCGAIGTNGVYESAVTLQIGAQVAKELRSRGVRVELTRNDDTFYTLEQRQRIGRQSSADLFVSIHANSAANGAKNLFGPEVYYYRSFSKAPAAKVHQHLVRAYRGIYKFKPGFSENLIPQDGGVRYYPFQVTRLEECPAILVECGYLSNSTECAVLCDSGNQKKLAKAIADGICEYVWSK